jgi:hypothetical protein
VPLAPEANRTGDVWHIALPGLDPSLLYGYRVYGSNDEQHEDSEGQRHDPVRAMHAVVLAVVWWRAVQRLSMRGRHVCCVPCRTTAKGIVCAHASRCGMPPCACACVQARVVLDPYSQVIVNGRQRWGEMGPVSRVLLPCVQLSFLPCLSSLCAHAQAHARPSSLAVCRIWPTRLPECWGMPPPGHRQRRPCRSPALSLTGRGIARWAWQWRTW